MLSDAPHPPRPSLGSLQHPEQGAHNQTGWPETGSRAQLSLLLRSLLLPLSADSHTYISAVLTLLVMTMPGNCMIQLSPVKTCLHNLGSVSELHHSPQLPVLEHCIALQTQRRGEHRLTRSSIWWCRGRVMMPARQRCVCMCVYMHVYAQGYRSVHLYTYLSHLIWQNYRILQAKGIIGIKYYLM